MSGLETVSKLETFVREQAKQFGEVISYVPAVTPTVPEIEVGKTATDSLTGLFHLLGAHREEGWMKAATLAEFETAIQDCQKCELGATRTRLVFGKGNPHSKIMIIGEAPGADEDASGEPFVGRAGQLLTKMLAAIDIKREDIYITNIVKSRPPNNRDPKPDEVAACEPYLWRQIELMGPKLILCLGRVAGANLLKVPSPSLANMRKQTYEHLGARVMVTYHPAALMRNPEWKRSAWEDLQAFRKLFDELPS